MAENKVYFNKPQRLTQLIGANTTVIVAGRRTGKTDSICTFKIEVQKLWLERPRHLTPLGGGCQSGGGAGEPAPESEPIENKQYKKRRPKSP